MALTTQVFIQKAKKGKQSFTKELFVKKAKEKHGETFDYSLVDYINSRTYVTMRCIPCDYTFETLPNNHLRGRKCRKCTSKKISEKYTKPQDEFIEECQEKHKDENGLPIYDYSLVDYKSTHKKIIIICKLHGSFEQAPSDHLSGKGCKDCGIKKRTTKQTFTQEQFIEKAIEKHGDKYDYSQVVYVNSQTKITLKCNICTYIFQQVPNSHLQGCGCDKCAHRINHENQKCNPTDIIMQSKKVHGDIYDYSEMNYVNSHIPINIRCKTCDHTFSQLYSNHIGQKQGCPFCSGRYVDTEIFIKNAKALHSDDFNYDEVLYEKSNVPVKIKCNKSNKIFKQTPNNHLQGSGCPCCGHKGYSKAQIKYLNFMATLKQNHIQHAENGGEYMIPNTKFKSDGYCAETNTIYEFHGDLWHGNPTIFDPTDISFFGVTYGELYQKTIKRETLIKDLGYNLVVMWERDWLRLNRAVSTIQKKLLKK